ncbi:MAG: glycosyltransferase family 4 protein [Rhodothermales bacterium]|nr:glycosyltransferase family 4 protein [Rhodothermales bacterium]
MRILVLLTDAYGGRGGIAKFNRDLLGALCTHPEVEDVVALPRVVFDPVEAVPEGLDYRLEATGGLRSYLAALWRALRRPHAAYDLVLCAHLNLLPFAAFAAWRTGAKLLLTLHGIEAWEPPEKWTRRALTTVALPHVDQVVAVSAFTRRRFGAWSGVPAERIAVVPNCVDASGYGTGPKRSDLLRRYGLEGRRILLTLARLPEFERYKGVDEVLEVLGDLVREDPDLRYLVVGDGDDRPRLEQKAEGLGVRDLVTFAGYVPEDEKADHYRLADAFVMPSRGEGFGIVYLEAMACGIPVVASSADASREAVRDGALGHVVDPADLESVKAGVRAALAEAAAGPPRVPDGLAYFSHDAFVERWHGVLDHLAPMPSAPSPPALQPAS